MFRKTAIKNQVLQVMVMLVLGGMFGLLAIYKGQDNTWDARDYHFYNGYAFLHQRLTWDFAPAMVQSFINPLFDMTNYLLIISQRAVTVSFIQGMLSGLSLFFVYQIARLIFLKRSAFYYSCIFFSVLIGATCSDNLAILGLITNDAKVSLLVIITLYCLLKFLLSNAEPLKTTHFYLAGLLNGLSMALKLTAAPYTVSTCLMMILFYRRRCDWKISFWFIVLAGVGFLLGDGYWMFVLYKNFSSPLFPYYNNIFHSPNAPLTNFNDGLYYPHDYLIFPFLVGLFKTTTVEHLRDLRFALVYIFSCWFVIAWIRKPNTQKAWFLLGWFWIAYLTWFFIFTIFRYALPLELMSGVLIVYLIDQLFVKEKFKLLMLCLLTVALFATTVQSRFPRIIHQTKFYAMHTPDLPRGAIVFLPSAPLAYVIPFFKNDIHFAGSFNLGNEKYFRELVWQQAKLLYTLDFASSTKNAITLSKNTLLLIDKTNCQALTTNIGDHLLLCKTNLRRTNGINHPHALSQ